MGTHHRAKGRMSIIKTPANMRRRSSNGDVKTTLWPSIKTTLAQHLKFLEKNTLSSNPDYSTQNRNRQANTIEIKAVVRIICRKEIYMSYSCMLQAMEYGGGLTIQFENAIVTIYNYWLHQPSPSVKVTFGSR